MNAPLLHPSYAPGWSRALPDGIDVLIAKLRASLAVTTETAPPVPAQLTADLVKP